MGMGSNNSLVRPATTGSEPIRASDIKQPTQFHNIESRPQESRITPKRIHINKIKKVPLEITLCHQPIGIEMRHRPPLLAPQTPRHPPHVRQNDSSAFIVCVIRQHKIRLCLDQVPQGPNPTAAQGIEDPEPAGGHPVEGGGEDAKVAIRNIRRKAVDELKRIQKDGEAGEDEVSRAEKELDKTTAGYVHQVDELVKHKESELLEV